MKRERYDMSGGRPWQKRRGGAALVVLRGMREVAVYGCQRILCYTPTRILLGVDRCSLEIAGSELSCTSFSGGAVTVVGYVTGVRYLLASEEVAP